MLTQARLKELLRYNRRTGVFTWLQNRGGTAVKGSVAGGLNSEDYIQIKIDGVLYKAHRLAWMYVNGAFPELEVDHRNGIRSENKFSNLRLADDSQTCCNRKVSTRSTSGVTGVHWNAEAGKWRARIKLHGRRILIGDFVRLDDAAAARLAFAKKIHGKFAGELRK